MKHPLPLPLIDTLEYIDNIPNLSNKTFTFIKKDYDECLSFLKQYSNNSSTFESYRREIERLIQWSWLLEKKSVLKLKREDIEKYLDFCLKPLKSWIGFKRTPRFIDHDGERIPNKQWRPFVVATNKADYKHGIKPDKNNYQLSQKAIREIFTVLSSFYSYLALENKIASNPIALIKQKSKYLQKYQQKPSIRRLSEKQWQACFETANAMAADNKDKHERTLFILSALYLMYLRISELVASSRWIPQMNHFYQDSNGYWWFKTIGKGNKLRNIAVPDEMLAALKRYRQSMKLPALPSINDKKPLISKEKGKGPIISTRHIRRLVQECFDETIVKLRINNLPTEANALESATVHWLRHTGISDDINKRARPIAHVRDDAGHSSSAITDRYNDIELTERYKSAKSKKLDTTA